MRTHLFRYATVIVGCLLCAAAVNMFYIPNQLLSGGISGLAFIVYYFSGFPLGVTNIIFNIPLFFIAYKLMNREYFIGALCGMFMYSVALDALSFLQNMVPHVDNKLLSCLAGAVISGVGSALIYRVGGSTGGIDIIGSIVNRRYGISIGTTGFLFNIVVLVASLFLFGLETVLYTTVAFFTAFKFCNVFTDGFDYKKNIIIISNDYEAIAAGIIQIVGRGVTYLYGEGAYTHQERRILFVVAKLTQVAKIKQIVSETDPNAFMIVQDTNDVFGRGFTLKSDHSIPRK